MKIFNSLKQFFTLIIASTPDGLDGLKFKAKYGYAGIYTEYEPFIVEGINETGLSAGLFFFPDYNIKEGIRLKALGHGSGMLGLPGDFTSPSRFIRAAFLEQLRHSCRLAARKERDTGQTS